MRLVPLSSKALWGILLLATIPLAYKEYWPHHTFPTSVAKLLRKGLWAESNKGEYDYQLALKYYIEALDEAKNLKLDPISDEYTGIQLKIAEMLERLSMYEEAFLIYSEILTLYLTVLTAQPDNPNFKPLTMDQRDHLIMKDLRLAVKIGRELENPNLMKPFMMTHLLIATDQICRKLGHGANLASAVEYVQRNAVVNGTSTKVSSQPLLMKPSKRGSVQVVKKTEDSLIVSCGDGTTLEIVQNPDAWEPFIDEYFQASDIYILSLILLEDITGAFESSINLWEQMILADYRVPHRFLQHTCNIGSLCFNRAEQYEYGEIKLRREIAKTLGIEDHLSLTAEQIEASDKVSRVDKDAFRELVKQKDFSIGEAKSTYEMVLNAIKENHQADIDKHADVINSDTSKEIQNTRYVAESSALASYGLGVINLHLGKFDDAERYLREARIKAKKIEYGMLIDNIEDELGKVFRERSQQSQ
ncbi:uncharacterized protein KQ657_002849 [Scheffersomyces spartinae]|uniref:Uncharacterized protein n=1 Tax=Scheffersomyces spartinae TaxID=45513 RepID=A0A9P7V5R6_9ASCO|nr:uncharacterized protein KQ657_002849 [Scheffersomyces spartinae]KAG7191713.1 hypothetical protein KQ657_002849 [Scheffersomyces spartinae]